MQWTGPNPLEGKRETTVAPRFVQRHPAPYQDSAAQETPFHLFHSQGEEGRAAMRADAGRPDSQEIVQ